jgi:hypothetical protein
LLFSDVSVPLLGNDLRARALRGAQSIKWESAML